MQRALIATAATVVGLVALLDYKSSLGHGAQKVNVASPGSTTTTAPATSNTTSGGGTSNTTAPSDNTSTTKPASKSGTYTSQQVQYQYGVLEVSLKVNNGRITDITFPMDEATDPRSESINSQALPILAQEALSAQSLNIDVVSGATYTSNAFAQGFQDAVSQEKG